MPDYYMPAPNNHKNANWLAILLLIFLVVYMCSNTNNINNIHKCNWENCSHYNKSVNVQTFSPEWGYEKDTDGYYIEITHIAQPTWSYKQCEEYVFTGVE